MLELAIALLFSSTSSAETATRALTLADAIELAMRVEPLVAEAYIAHDRSELGVLRARLDRISLKVDAQVQELWNKSNIGGPMPDSQCSVGAIFDPAACAQLGGRQSTRPISPEVGLGLSNLSASLTVPLFAGFRIEANADRARHLEQAASQDYLQQRKDTALSVARVYWAVRRIGLLREVQARALERLREAEEIAAGRVRAGLAPPIDRNRAASRLLEQEATSADLGGQLREATEQLRVLLGAEMDVVLVDSPASPDFLPPAVDDLLAGARLHRPEIRSAHRRLEAQADLVRMAMASYYPQLSGFALFQYGNNPFVAGAGSRAVFASTNPLANLSGNFQVGLTLSINIFDTLNTYTAVEDARYEESRLGQEERRIGRVIEADVRLARARVAHFHELRRRWLPAEDVARDNLNILRKRYENGEARVFELLDSEVELLNIERQRTDATAQLQLAWLELEAALGAIVGEKR